MLLVKKQVKIGHHLGLHARPCAKIATLARSFSADIWLGKPPLRANAKSIMGLMKLAGQYEEYIDIEALGSDAMEAVNALATFISQSDT